MYKILHLPTGTYVQVSVNSRLIDWPFIFKQSAEAMLTCKYGKFYYREFGEVVIFVDNDYVINERGYTQLSSTLKEHFEIVEVDDGW